MYKTKEEYRQYLATDNNWAFNTHLDYSFSEDRKEIVSVMDIKSGMDILDIGCAGGKTLASIGQKYPGVNLHGIEPDIQLASQADDYGNIFTGTVENYLKICHQKFDAIICADVIEHLKEPWIVVRDLATHLKDGGAIYASIPNFFHASVMYNLFACGSFSYSSNDIINKEHLRFFTLNDIAALFEMAGLKHCMVGGLKGVFPQETIEKVKLLGNVFYHGDYDYYFNIYQFIIKATKE
ncbi:MAG: class I SAM-dependent methyltransferase [Pseudomonadota bacterium]